MRIVKKSGDHLIIENLQSSCMDFLYQSVSVAYAYFKC